MRGEINLFICVLLFSISVLFSGCCSNITYSKIEELSLTSYCFSNCNEFQKNIMVPVNQTYYFDNYDLTLCEYVIDKSTGIGAVKCKIKTNIYNKYKDAITLFLDPNYLLTEKNVEVVQIEDDTFLYYRFVLKSWTEPLENVVIYVDRTNINNNINIKTINFMSKTIIDNNKNVSITVSPLGIKTEKSIVDSYNNSNNNCSVDTIYFDIDNSIETFTFTSKTSYSDSDGYYEIYIFKNLIDTDDLYNNEEFKNILFYLTNNN